MLQNLHVKNLALIDEVDVDFSEGINILSGETGAGKSIILGSLNLALGAKADKDIIRTDCEFGFVELSFVINDYQQKLLEKMDVYPEDGVVVLSRKITRQRSLFKVNGETVGISDVKNIASVLIDVYGQHDYRDLLNSQKHIDILDAFSGVELKTLLDEYKILFDKYNELKRILSRPEMDEQKREREISLLKYQINEIEASSLKVGEEEEIRQKLKVMENSAKIKETLANVSRLLWEDEYSASSNVDRAMKDMLSIASFDTKLSDMSDSVSLLTDELSDLSRRIDSYLEENDIDEESLIYLRERYELINELERKYGRSVEEVLSYKEERVKELEELLNLDSSRQRVSEEFEKISSEMLEKTAEIHEVRIKYKKLIEEKIRRNLSDLNFIQSEFEVEIIQGDDFMPNGRDSVNFMISTNPGEPLKPLSNVASGGELSRIMLALKSVIANNDDIETLIFDEIDSGISGITARKVAEKLASLAVNHQIICITHLQQIAAMADRHFLIEKNVSVSNRTFSTISLLDEEGELTEISRMLGDESSTGSFRENALELKNRAKEYKSQLIV